MSKTRFVEKSARGMKIVTETGPYREKAVTGPGTRAEMLMMPGSVSDLSATFTGDVNVKRPGGGK